MQKHKNLVFGINDALPFSTPPLHILDIGALFEEEPVYAKLLEHDGVTLTGFEPQKEAREALEKIFGSRGQWIDHFLGDGKEHNFFVTRYPGCCSLFEPNPEIIDSFVGMGTDSNANFHVVSVQKISTKRLNEIDQIHSVEFAQIDVQGSELMILENGMEKLDTALVIQVEAAFYPLYKKQPLFADLHLFLQKHGFDLHKFIDITGRSYRPLSPPNPLQPISQIIEADAVFVRNMKNPDALSEEELLQASHILHDAYNSYDLVYRLLLEHDRKAPIKVAKFYMQALNSAREQLRPRFLDLKLKPGVVPKRNSI